MDAKRSNFLACGGLAVVYLLFPVGLVLSMLILPSRAHQNPETYVKAKRVGSLKNNMLCGIVWGNTLYSIGVERNKSTESVIISAYNPMADPVIISREYWPSTDKLDTSAILSRIKNDLEFGSIVDKSLSTDALRLISDSCTSSYSPQTSRVVNLRNEIFELTSKGTLVYTRNYGSSSRAFIYPSPDGTKWKALYGGNVHAVYATTDHGVYVLHGWNEKP